MAIEGGTDGAAWGRALYRECPVWRYGRGEQRLPAGEVDGRNWWFGYG